MKRIKNNIVATNAVVNHPMMDNPYIIDIATLKLPKTLFIDTEHSRVPVGRAYNFRKIDNIDNTGISGVVCDINVYNDKLLDFKQFSPVIDFDGDRTTEIITNGVLESVALTRHPVDKHTKIGAIQ